MRHTAVILAITFIVGLVPGAAFAQVPRPYEMRTFLSETTDPETYQWNMSNVRQRYVCPYCGYSTRRIGGTPAEQQCPNPWNASGHPGNVELQDLGEYPNRRIVDLAAPDMASAATCDLVLYGSDFTTPRYKAIIGRPFHPTDLPNDTRRSVVHAKAAGLDNHADIDISSNRFRFLFIAPTPSRRDTPDGGSYRVVSRRPMAYHEPPEELYKSNAGASDFVPDSLKIGPNPFRVDEYDTWFLRYRETTDTMGAGFYVTAAHVEVYSVLNGLVYEETIATPFGMDADTPIPFSVLTDCGSLRLHFTQPWDVTGAHSYQWVVRVRVRSNCRTMPSWADVANDTDPPFVRPDSSPGGSTTWDWSADPDFPERKKSWLTDSDSNNLITTEDSIEETGGPGLPFVLRMNETGLGTVALLWASDSDTPGAAASANSTHYRPGLEWRYDENVNVTNESVAQRTNNYGGGSWYVRFIASRFMSTRVHVPPTGTTWVRGSQTEPAEYSDYARLILGALDGTNIINWLYPPGMQTPGRSLPIVNRWNGASETRVCPVSGATWGPDAVNPPTESPYADFDIEGTVPLQLLSDVGSGSFTAEIHNWRAPSVVGRDERFPGAPVKRHVMRPDAFDRDPNARWISHGTTIDNPRMMPIRCDIPNYQPPSVPAGANPAINNPENDRGYRGGEVLFQVLGSPGGDSLTGNWDTFYKNPNTGTFHRSLPVTTPAASSYYCPASGLEQLRSGDSPFSGMPMNGIPANSAVREEHLQAQEYDVYEIQVSVARKVEAYAAQAGLDLGRSAPGVETYNPDTTIGRISDPARRAFPADTTRHSEVPLLNEGNVIVPLHVANTYDFDGTLLDRALPHFLRVGSNMRAWSFGRSAQSAPVTRETIVPYFDTDYDTATGSLRSRLWALVAQDVNQPAGFRKSGALQVGRVDTTTGESEVPVPLGQPVGTYSGAQLVFIDSSINGNPPNGVFDFLRGGATGVPVTSAQYEFDPVVDIPLEPLVAIVPGGMRVVEGRLPHSDYYAGDTNPTVRMSDIPGTMQVIWSTNRPAAGSVGNDAPAGTSPLDMPSSAAPWNLVYANATGVTGGANDPLYRLYRWETGSGGTIRPPRALTADNTLGTINSAPWTTLDSDGTHWVMWHRRLKHAGGVESTLRFDSSNNWTWNGSSATEFIYATGMPKENLKGFSRPVPGPAGSQPKWLFWHSGPQGRERIMYRWEFTGSVDSNEGPVPVSNQAPAGTRNDIVQTREGWRVRRAANSPFVYTKDPSVFLQTMPGGTDVVNLMFSGYMSSDQQADICWTRFDRATMRPANTPDPVDNLGKMAFRRVPTDAAVNYSNAGNYEELRGNGLRQRFNTRHLDWVVPENFDSAGPITSYDAASPAPAFIVALVFDTHGDGLPPDVQYFHLTWSNGNYMRSRGTYRVTPVLLPINGSSIPEPWGIPTGGGWYLRDPNTAHLATPRPLMLDVDPASGTLLFSSPLFNIDAPADRTHPDFPNNPADPIDPTAALNPRLAFGGHPLIDVALYANYVPYVFRVTYGGAHDDSPTAFYDPTGEQRLTVFWRRSYPSSQAPHFGRASFMYKVLSYSVQVGRPPVRNWVSVENNSYPYTTDNARGTLTADARDERRFLRITYVDDVDGETHVERHQVMGWSNEVPVPIDTVMGEGSLVVVPENYTVPATDTTPPDWSNAIPATRYWLFWSSPRGVWDIRLVTNPSGSTRWTPANAGDPHDLPIHPSSDIYSAVVVPELGSLMPEIPASVIPRDPT